VNYIEHSQDLTFLSDGERRYGNTLFELCAEEFRNGQRGRPPKTLPEGVKLRLKNKGSQKSKLGRKRPKYGAPKREHPDTVQDKYIYVYHCRHGQSIGFL